MPLSNYINSAFGIFFRWPRPHNETSPAIRVVTPLNAQDRTIYTSPIVYATHRHSGIGDVSHFIDFLGSVDEQELQNAYFWIQTELTNNDDIQDIINHLIPTHPLRKYAHRLLITGRGADNYYENFHAMLLELTGNPEYLNFYQVSTFVGIPRDFTPGVHASLIEHNYLSNYEILTKSPHRPKQFTMFYNSMGLSTNEVGAFLTADRNVADYVYKQTLTKFKIPLGAGVIVLYKDWGGVSSRYIHTFILLAKGQKKEFIIIAKNFNGLDAITKEELSQCPNITLRQHDEWINEEHMQALLKRQATHGKFCLVSGDKTSEESLRHGLFPIIGTQKCKFWYQIAAIIEQLSAPEGQWHIHQQNIHKIVNYIRVHNDPRKHCPLSSESLNEEEITAIQAIDDECIELWHNLICPYLRDNFDITHSIAQNVKLLRSLCEILQHPHNDTASIAASYLDSLPQETVDDCINKNFFIASEQGVAIQSNLRSIRQKRVPSEIPEHTFTNKRARRYAPDS